MAWLTLVQGVVWIGLAASQIVPALANGMAWALLFWGFIAAWGVFALSAAWDALKCRAAGFRRMMFVFALCLFQIAYAGDAVSFFFYLDSVLKLSFSFSAGGFSLGINFAAIVFIVLAQRNFRYLDTLFQNAAEHAKPPEQGQNTQP